MARKYLQAHLEFLKEKYTQLSLAELVIAFNDFFPNFNASESSIRACLRNHRIKSGRTGRFEHGCEVWNKGKKGLCAKGSEKGWFKKGSVPKNVKPLGHERVCTKDGYILVKVSEQNPYTGHKTRYRAKHQVVWEDNNGPIPKGHAVIFKDGNKLNCCISNLLLVTRAELAILNKSGLIKVPSEAKDSALLLAKLKIKTRKVEANFNK